MITVTQIPQEEVKKQSEYGCLEIVQSINSHTGESYSESVRDK